MDLDKISAELSEMNKRGQSQQDKTFQIYLEANHVEHWIYAHHVDCYLVLTNSAHYYGYCRFPKPLLQEPGYHGFVNYVPVHGGITLTTHNPDGSVTYGFDCAHSGDSENPLCHDLIWLRTETEKMAQCLALAADGYERDYLAATDTESKCAVVDAYHQRLRDEQVADFELTDNFGAMMNVLFGQV